ncbi:MAG: translocation/assembly module TamB domain-containing protein, partial [Pseudomonadota bacterium]
MLRQLLRGNTLAMIGLFLGLTTGAVVLLAKHWLVNEIVTALEEEVVASCDCSLSFDSISLSFTTLRARARNVRILERGVPRLSFKDIRAKVDLSEIRERKVHLTSLVLNQGLADGVGPDSATFKFIDHLTAPLPPEKQLPDRWRVILDTLEVKNSFLRESFGTSEISGSGVSLYVKRIGENFSLLPTIADFRYTSYGDTPGEPPTELYLGPLTGSIVIEDNRTVFNSILLGRDRSRIEAKMVTDSNRDNAASGSTKLTITPDYIGLPSWLRGAITGTTDIRGTIGSPLLTGSINAAPGESLSIALPAASELSLPNFSSSLTIDVNHGDPVITLSNISGANDRASLSSTRPLTFSDEGLSAGFKASVPNYTFGPFAVGSSNASIELEQERDEVVTSIELTTENLVGNGINLGPAKIGIRLDSDAVEITADSTNPAQGSLSWRGTIDLAQDQPILNNGLLKLKSFRYPTALPVVESNLSPIAITSDLTLKGPLAINRLTGEGETTVTFPALNKGFPLSGRTTLKDGVLKVSLPNSPQRASADLTVDFAKTLDGKLNFNLPQLALRDLIGYDDPCSVLGGSLNYSFTLAKVLRGVGELALDTLSIGCKPYSLTLPSNTRVPIRDGALQLKNLSLATLDSSLKLDGQVGVEAGFDMSARGRLELSSLLPLLPAVDDLQGMLNADIIVKGALREPTVTGSAQLSKGQFGVSAPDVGGDSITGDFTLAGKAIQIKSLTGKINNGTFSASGTLLPFDPTRSTLQTTLKQVTIEPIEDATITFSGDLRLGADRNKRQTLGGEIDISFAEVAKDFDINKIIMNTISGYFLPARAQPSAAKSKIDIDLDVKIGAPRNVFIVTPFLSAELNTAIHARGNAAAPIIDGNMQVLSGWIGLKGNRFDITSGGITFKPPNLVPTLEIASEGTLRAPTGENVLVTLEASGLLSSPKITLNSDRGLAQSDLLLLLTSSRRLGESSIRGRMDSQFGADQRYFMSDTSFSSIKDFFRNLTRLDILSFEPAYNQFTGTIEPAVVARKNISPRLTMLGESLFSSVSNSRAGAVYALTPSLDINGFFQTVSTQKNSILSTDLTYTVWAEESRFVTYEITGLNAFSEQSIYNAARLGPASRIQSSNESLDGIKRQIVDYLADHGHKAASVGITCQDADRFCHRLIISIDEGAPCLIDEITFEGTTLPDNLIATVRDTAKKGDLATISILDKIERKLVLALRGDGYIAARVTPSYVISPDRQSATLIVNAEPREPISFVFTGNKEFSSDDFLNSIDLFTRKRPFGNNTINLLVQNIERMYQERGYLFVSVNYTEDRSDPGRLMYRVEIKEEAPTSVKSLTIAGNSSLPLNRLTKVMTEMGMGDQSDMLNPEHAVPSELDALRDSLIAAYQREGFPDASATYSINQIPGTDKLEITYNIVEGSARKASEINVSGYPSDLKLPAPPAVPASLPRVNNYIESLADSLKSEGYLHPALFVEPNADNTAIQIEIEPGARTNVASVQYEGLI